MTEYERHQAEQRKRDAFEAAVCTILISLAALLAWWLS